MSVLVVLFLLGLFAGVGFLPLAACVMAYGTRSRLKRLEAHFGLIAPSYRYVPALMVGIATGALAAAARPPARLRRAAIGEAR